MYGPFVRPLGGWIAIADLVRLMGELGLDGDIVRSTASRMTAMARAAWAESCRPGRPMLWGQAHFAFGAADERPARRYLRDYYAFTGPFADRVADCLITSRQQLLELIAGYREAGCDHLCLLPAVASLAQLDRLSEARAEAAVA